MALEKDAKKIESCWFRHTALSQMKLANQGHLTGNHTLVCPLGRLAIAAEYGIHSRDSDDEPARSTAEKEETGRRAQKPFRVNERSSRPLPRLRLRAPTPAGVPISCRWEGDQTELKRIRSC